MKRATALFFSISTVILLLGISMAISYGMAWLAILLTAVTVLFMGAGFMVKARSRRGSLPKTND